jgi:transposase-like protein
LRLPTTITSDGAPGLVKAITVCFPASIRIRCWFHRLANIRAKLPDEAAAEVMAHVYAVRDAPTVDAARAAADRLISGYRGAFPAAVACFADDLDALLAIHRVPVRHRIRVRTTNLAERSFVEERRRTKVIGRFGDERSAMKLVFATMIRAADRWCRVSISDLERHQLRLLRTELGLPATTSRNRQPQNRPTQKRRRMINQATDLQDAQDLTTSGHQRPESATGTRPDERSGRCHVDSLS